MMMRAMARRKVLFFGLIAVGTLALPALPASAGWLEESGLSFIEGPKPADPTPSPFTSLDLSVVRDGTESALRAWPQARTPAIRRASAASCPISRWGPACSRPTAAAMR